MMSLRPKISDALPLPGALSEILGDEEEELESFDPNIRAAALSSLDMTRSVSGTDLSRPFVCLFFYSSLFSHI